MLPAAMVTVPLASMLLALAPGETAPDFVVEEAVGDLGPVTDFAFLPAGEMVILEKDGNVKVRAANGAVTVAARFPVDDASEKGMLGVAVDPAFASNRRLFLYYSLADKAGGSDLDRHHVVSVVLSPERRIDLAAQKILVRGLRGPRNHDGGGLAVGPDGKLYVGVGDTGCNSNRRPDTPYEPTNTFGTCLTNGNGKILRVELDGAIPRDNPLAGGAKVTACGRRCGDTVSPSATAAPRADIWAWGLRNPWRFWFDPKTKSLWAGDVGEITWEEITIVEKGKHHGWPWREGAAGWPRAKCDEVTPGAGACVEPVYACMHPPSMGDMVRGGGKTGGGNVDADCQSITGGVILDGCPWPAAQRGLYLFGDNANARMWTLKVNAPRNGVEPRSRREVARLTGLPVSIHLGPDGAAYVASFPGDAGRVLRVRPKHPDASCGK